MAVDKLHKAWAELDQLERHLAERFSYIHQTTRAQKVEIDDMAKGRPPAIHRLLQNYFRRFLSFASQTQSVKTRTTLLVRRDLEPPNSPNFWTSVKLFWTFGSVLDPDDRSDVYDKCYVHYWTLFLLTRTAGVPLSSIIFENTKEYTESSSSRSTTAALPFSESR
ncbi:hypothetical protein SCLCIDRAFT_29295 [Scleroderma citrinum Foug A]|uniref:Uncharacterized protein n=1 Tax=Scleroderma citrinum Foug A TaxID=1036808 RepID=A0A0C3DKA5_9AGAM|nr:hypothetical protein SCLCIDRAFT_29295 [Scleroderma citrinum Foug A]